MKTKVDKLSIQDKVEDEIFGKPVLKAQKKRANDILNDFDDFVEIRKRLKYFREKIDNATSILEINRVLREIRAYM